MNQRLKYIPLLFLIGCMLSACGATTVTRVNLNTGAELAAGERCPVGDTCLTDVNTGDSLAGGGVGRSITMGTEGDCIARHANGAPILDAQGHTVMERCKQQSVASGFVPAHSDVLGAKGIEAAGHVLAAGVNAYGMIRSSEKLAEGTRDAGPSSVNFTDVRTYTATDVGVSSVEKTIQYFDPTK